MNLFLLTNYLTILIAEEIIKQKGLADNIALVYPMRGYLDGVKFRRLIDQSLFKEIIQIDEYPPYNQRNNAIIYRLYLRKQNRFIRKFYNKMLNFDYVLSAYVPVPTSLEGSALIQILSLRGISVNLFDEGVPEVYTPPFRQTHISISIKVKNLLRLVLEYVIYYGSNNLFNSRSFSKLIKSYPIRGYYALFPDLLNNYNFPIIEVNISNIIEKSPLIIPSNINSLFLSRPMSEDNLVSLDEELQVLQTIYNFLPSGTYIKFHPRESEEKIKIITSKFTFIPVTEELMDVPAEFFLKSNKLNVISGYYSNSLLIASKFSNFKVISFIGLFNKFSSSPVVFDKINEDFPNLIFISNSSKISK
jgi:hypothetical protein